MFQLTNIITVTRVDLVWLKLGMTHTAGPGQAQLNRNQMTYMWEFKTGKREANRQLANSNQ